MIQFRCPSCSSEIETPDDYAGRPARCPTCNRRIRVPRKSAQPALRDDAEPAVEEPSTARAMFQLDGRTYQVRPRLEGLLLAAAVVNVLSVVALVAVGMVARVRAPWFLAGLIAAAVALFAALLVVPAYYNIRRSRGRKTGQRLVFVDFAAAAVLVVVFLAVALVARASADDSSCYERLKAVHRALIAYAARNGGLLPPRPETLVEQGDLPASKLTCPDVGGVREGTPTYDRHSYRRDPAGQAVIDLRFRDDASRRFPDDLMVLMCSGVSDVLVDEKTGRRVRAHYVLRLDGSITYVPADAAARQRALDQQVRTIRRVLTDRAYHEEDPVPEDPAPPTGPARSSP
jgi:DNA-directed RNA polymerase subunit RPC12/RpoP